MPFETPKNQNSGPPVKMPVDRRLFLHESWIAAIAVIFFCVLLFIPAAYSDGTAKTSLSDGAASKKQTVDAQIRDVPIYGKNTQYSYTIHPRAIDVTVRILTKHFPDGLPRKNIDAYVDMKGMAPGIYAKPVTIDLPEGAFLLKASPKVFVIKIQPPRPTNNQRE